MPEISEELPKNNSVEEAPEQAGEPFYEAAKERNNKPFLPDSAKKILPKEFDKIAKTGPDQAAPVSDEYVEGNVRLKNRYTPGPDEKKGLENLINSNAVKIGDANAISLEAARRWEAENPDQKDLKEAE